MRNHAIFMVKENLMLHITYTHVHMRAKAETSSVWSLCIKLFCNMIIRCHILAGGIYYYPPQILFTVYIWLDCNSLNDKTWYVNCAIRNVCVFYRTLYSVKEISIKNCRSIILMEIHIMLKWCEQMQNAFMNVKRLVK